jgi:formylglycine-generating enzyme required for sulfatase activity
MVEVPLGDGFFCMDSTEVTNEQYSAFLAASPDTASQPTECAWNTDFEPASGWPAASATNPVVYVDWCDARAYCEWTGKRLCGGADGQPITDAQATFTNSQWYMACSAEDTRTHPYDATPGGSVCPYVYESSITAEGVHDNACCGGPVRGLQGLLTNVMEWVDACDDSTGATDTCVAMGSNDSFSGIQCNDATVTRQRQSVSETIGFRCCAL